MTSTADGAREAIHEAETAYSEARGYIDGITEEQMLAQNRVGVWSGKDLVVHLAIWEREGVRIVGDLAEGGAGARLPDGVDLDIWNVEQVSQHADLSLVEALAYWDNEHRAFVAAYEASGLDRPDLLLDLSRDHYRQHYPDFRHIKPFKPLTAEQRGQLLGEMDASHAEFRRLIDSIPDAALERPETVGVWSGKDLIAHLGHWQEAAASIVRSLESDQPGKWPGEDGSDINEWNQARVDAARGMSLAAAKDGQQRAYDELREIIATSPKATRSAGIGGTQFHYGIHREDFERLAEPDD